MAEMAAVGEDHGHTGFVRRGNHFGITHAAAGLNGGGGTSRGGGFNPIWEGEESIRGDGTAF